MTADLIEEAREPLDDARKLLSRHVEDWTRRSAEIAEGIVTAYVDTVPALLDTITALQARAEAAEAKLARMREALELAANRLHRCSVDYDTGTREFIEVGEWAAEARAALKEE